jgi:hypothetical protein
MEIIPIVKGATQPLSELLTDDRLPAARDAHENDGGRHEKTRRWADGALAE